MPEITLAQMRELCDRVADNCTRDLLLVFTDYVGRLECGDRSPDFVAAILGRLGRIEGEAKIECMAKAIAAVQDLRAKLS